MSKVDTLYKEYNEIKEKLLKNKSLNLQEDFKNKLIELDYAINEEYEKMLETNFPMTTTLEKEKERLQKLISFIEEKSLEQNKLIDDYKKITGETIELSYLKYTDNLKSYKERLHNVKKIINIIKDIKNITKNPENKNDLKLKVTKNKLMKKELLNLLYEFCLIDSLDIKEIDTDRLIKPSEFNENSLDIPKEPLPPEEEIKTIELPEKEEINKETIEKTKEENKEELKVEVVPEQQEEKILTTMPIVEKIGSVVPVNVFESLQKTEEKLPNVVLPSNGLKDDQNDIFLDTKDLFEEEEKK